MGRLTGGKDVLLALGFEQQDEEGEELQAPRTVLVLNRCRFSSLFRIFFFSYVVAWCNTVGLWVVISVRVFVCACACVGVWVGRISV